MAGVSQVRLLAGYQELPEKAKTFRPVSFDQPLSRSHEPLQRVQGEGYSRVVGGDDHRRRHPGPVLHGSHLPDIGAESHRPIPQRAGRSTGSVLLKEVDSYR